MQRRLCWTESTMRCSVLRSRQHSPNWFKLGSPSRPLPYQISARRGVALTDGHPEVFIDEFGKCRIGTADALSDAIRFDAKSRSIGLQCLKLFGYHGLD